MTLTIHKQQTQIEHTGQVNNAAALVPANAGKDRASRLGQYAAWLDAEGMAWHNPDLAAYRDELLSRLAPSSAAAHLSTIRARYSELINDNRTRDFFYSMAPANADALTKKAFVDELITRLENATKPGHSRVKVVTKRDTADSEHYRLTSAQASALMTAPGLNSVKAIRDTAVIALTLCTGAREAEIAGLVVKDLRQRLGGALALHIRDGKGAVARLVPYGDLDWCLAIVQKWLSAAAITDGPVFRAIDRHGNIGNDAITTRSIRRVMKGYPITVDGRLVTVAPHDLRRTYARRLYEAGFDLLAIQQNLGHADSKTTLGYIGEMDADKRQPPAIYAFDLAALDAVPVQKPLE